MSAAPNDWTLTIYHVRKKIGCDKHVMKIIMAFVLRPVPWTPQGGSYPYGPWNVAVETGWLASYWHYRNGRTKVTTEYYVDRDGVGVYTCFFCGAAIGKLRWEPRLYEGILVDPCEVCDEQIFVAHNWSHLKDHST